MKRAAAIAALCALVSATFVCSAPTARAQADFSHFVCFGDSLTHNEILAVINDKPVELYGADPMEAVFLKGGEPGDELARYAVAGSTSADVLGQIDFYEFLVGIGLQDRATLFALEAGANDLLDNVELLTANAPGQSPAADAVINGIIANLRDAFLRLRSDVPGVRFVVWTLPDLALTPRFFGVLTIPEMQNLRAHVDRVNRKIRAATNRPRVAVLEVDVVLEAAIINPPILRGVPLQPPPPFGDFADLFADDIHPTAVSNAILANEASDRINVKFNDTIPFYTEDELADLAMIP